MKAAHKLRRLVLRIQERELGSRLAWLLFIVVLEILGRSADDEIDDYACLTMLIVAGIVTYRAHAKEELRWLESIWDRLCRLASPYNPSDLDIGLDFRSRSLRSPHAHESALENEPQITGSRPPIVYVVVASLLVLMVLAAAAGPFGLISYRSLLTPFSYSIYLISFGVLLLGLFVQGFLALFLFCSVLHDTRRKRALARLLTTDQRPKGTFAPEFSLKTRWIVFAVILGYSFLAILTPPWLPLVGMLILSIYHLFLFPPEDDCGSLVWRHRKGKLRAMSFAETHAYFPLVFFATGSILYLFTCGDRLASSHPISPNLPLTSILGTAVVWTTFGLLTVFTWFFTGIARLRLHMLRARERRPTLSLAGCSLSDQPVVRDRLSKVGWDVRFDQRERNDVPARLCEEVEEDAFADPTWPRPVTLETLTSDASLYAYRTRCDRQCRRRLIRGLRRLLETVRAYKYDDGEGYWITPQHWFCWGLSRDSDNDELDHPEGTILDDSLGPRYHDILDWQARAYFSKVLAEIDIDLIFVEQGISFRKLRRVLDAMFEYHTVVGAAPIQEKHFPGITPLHVIIHDYEMGDKLDKEAYPEPDYEEIGRARILHVFRDRGGERENLDVPTDSQGVPVGSAG